MTETIWDEDGGSGQAMADRVAKSSLLLPTRILRTDGGFDMSDDLNQDNWVFLPSDDEYLYFWYKGDHLYFMDADQTANTDYDSERIVGGVFHPETPLPDGDINHV
ncbi:hypothetical protein ACFTWF_32665 [Rhodococcus sp. NPDC056960]|uniref:hypothetical protein n=1 Tax=Rhodococcus sp. NPDC056960 TaxID=3345982 RepID=UPI00363D6F7F